METTYLSNCYFIYLFMYLFMMNYVFIYDNELSIYYGYEMNTLCNIFILFIYLFIMINETIMMLSFYA